MSTERSAEILNFPKNDESPLSKVTRDAYKYAYEHSGSRQIAERVSKVVSEKVGRSKDQALIRGDSFEHTLEDCGSHLAKVRAILIEGLITLATDAEMLAADHDPHNHRER